MWRDDATYSLQAVNSYSGLKDFVIANEIAAAGQPATPPLLMFIAVIRDLQILAAILILHL